MRDYFVQVCGEAAVVPGELKIFKRTLSERREQFLAFAASIKDLEALTPEQKAPRCISSTTADLLACGTLACRRKRWRMSMIWASSSAVN